MQGFLHTKRDAGKDGNREGRGEVKQMYYSIKSGGWQRIAEPTYRFLTRLERAGLSSITKCR